MSRSNHAPDRFDWWHGEPVRASASIMFRDASNADIDQMNALVRAASNRKFSPRLLGRLLYQHSYSLRLACRNHRHAVALCASKHACDGSKVLLCYCAPNFRGEGIERALLEIATAELPEAWTEYAVAHNDQYMQRVLAASGWSLIRGDESPDSIEPWLYRFTPAPCKARDPEICG